MLFRSVSQSRYHLRVVCDGSCEHVEEEASKVAELERDLYEVEHERDVMQDERDELRLRVEELEGLLVVARSLIPESVREGLLVDLEKLSSVEW